MSDQTTTGEFKHWVESLRDRLSQVSEGSWEGGESGFDPALKTDLLDAVELLLGRENEQRPPDDMLRSSFDQISERFAGLLEQATASYEESLARLEEGLEQRFDAWSNRLDELRRVPKVYSEESEPEWPESQRVSLSEFHELQTINESLRQQLEELERGDEGEAMVHEAIHAELANALEEAKQRIADQQQENEALKDQLAQAHSSEASASSSSGSSDSMSWEERKRLMLQQLECDESGPKTHQERLEIEQVIAHTNDELSRKDREIQSLRQQLEEATLSNREASDEILDSDEIVQQERERLKALQQEWEEKLRSAEIDLSIERAKIARERTELEKQMSTISKETGTVEGETNAVKSRPRRWLDHLGLRDDSGDDG